MFDGACEVPASERKANIQHPVERPCELGWVSFPVGVISVPAEYPEGRVCSQLESKYPRWMHDMYLDSVELRRKLMKHLLKIFSRKSSNVRIVKI